MTAITMPAPAKRGSLEPWVFDSVEYGPWQVTGIRDCCRRRSFLLADEMGLGKTLQALTVFAVDVVMDKSLTMVVIAPATLKDNWADEIEKFTRFPYIILGRGVHPRTGRIITLGPADRVAQLVQFRTMTGPKILICNYEQIDPHIKELNAMRFDIACFDEAHLMKNHKAKRTKACLSLYSRRSFMLTGSPMLNQVNELWTLLNRIDPGRFPKFWPFVMRYAVFGGYEGKQIVGVKNQRELNGILQEYMVRRLAKDWLGLDEPQYIPRTVDLHPRQRDLYDEVVDDMRLTTGDGPEDIQNALTKFLRLKQICGTTATVIDEDHSHKLDLAIQDDMDLVRIGEKVVVFTQFRGVMAAYVNRLTQACIKEKLPIPIFELHGDVKTGDRIPLVHEWERVTGPAVIVCMLQVAGVGLNMTAAHHCAFLDKLFVPALNRQAVARLHRMGQKYPVQVREYRVKGTIETRIEAILRTKSGLFKNVVDAGDYKKLLYLAMKAAEDDDD
jgi:SNF2 family DNA or RNA helicase